jgi:hypothetical protein
VCGSEAGVAADGDYEDEREDGRISFKRRRCLISVIHKHAFI